MKCDDCNVRMVARKATPDKPYHYLISGLINVYLVGVTILECPECGAQGVDIPHGDELDRTIAHRLAKKAEPLVGEEARYLREWAGFSMTDFAKLLGVRREHLSRFENGASKTLGTPTDTLLRAVALDAKSDSGVRDALRRLVSDAKRVSPKAPAVFTYRRGWKAAA